MIEQIPVEPKIEAQKIVSGYLTGVRLGKENIKMAVDRPTHWLERDEIYDRDRAEDGLMSTDEKFGQTIDDLRSKKTSRSKQILEEIVRLLGHRIDLTYVCKDIIRRIKDELNMEKDNI